MCCSAKSKDKSIFIIALCIVAISIVHEAANYYASTITYKGIVVEKVKEPGVDIDDWAGNPGTILVDWGDLGNQEVWVTSADFPLIKKNDLIEVSYKYVPILGITKTGYVPTGSRVLKFINLLILSFKIPFILFGLLCLLGSILWKIGESLAKKLISKFFREEEPVVFLPLRQKFQEGNEVVIIDPLRDPDANSKDQP